MEKFTLKDRLVKESLKSISELDNEDLNIIIVGGVACQLYSVSPDFLRPTSDLDSLPSYQISSKEFRESVGKDISSHLAKLGYPITLGKKRFSYELGTKEDNEPFFIHIARFSDSYFKRHKEWKQREIDNAKVIYVPEIEGRPLLIHRIEDVLANKARRLRMLEREGYITDENLEEWQKFQDEDINKLGSVDLNKKLEYIKQIRGSLVNITKKNFTTNQSQSRINSYKVLKDLYDITLLSRTILEGEELIDIAYLRESLAALPAYKSIRNQ